MSDGGSGPGILIIVVLAVIFWIGPAALASWLAGERGRDAGAWFVVGLVFGPLAVVAVGLSPIETGHRCTECLGGVPAGAKVCMHCGARFTRDAETDDRPMGVSGRPLVEHRPNPTATTPGQTGTPTDASTESVTALEQARRSQDWQRQSRVGALVGTWRIEASGMSLLEPGDSVTARDENGAIGLYQSTGEKRGLLIEGEYVVLRAANLPRQVMIGDRSGKPVLLLERLG